jgi:hypothetical protein
LKVALNLKNFFFFRPSPPETFRFKFSLAFREQGSGVLIFGNSGGEKTLSGSEIEPPVSEN